MRICLILVINLLLGIGSYAQEVGLDTTMVELAMDVDSTVIKVHKERIPGRAALYSLIIPGAGQIYNRKIWKAPIIYAALGTTIYLIDYNRDFYRDLRDAYVQRLAGEEDKYTGIISSAEGIKNARDSFRKNMELAYFATAAVYILQVIEAYVDAHLHRFDVAEDLSIHFFPQQRFENDPAVVKVGLFVSL